MAKTQDYTKALNDMMGSFPVDLSAYQDAFKAQAGYGEKLTSVALDAAEKANEISTRATKETLARIGNAAKAKTEPADYAKAMTDFASAQAELISENVAAYSEIGKRVQMDTIELMLNAGKNLSEDASAAVKKATDEVTKAAKKATVAAK